MQIFYKRFSITIGFLLLFIVLITNALITRREVGLQTSNRDRADHSQQVFFQITQTESLLDQAEAGQRGFLYTNDPAYLVPYDRAATQLGSQLRQLAQLVSDDPGQQARLVTLRGLIHSKMVELAETITLVQMGEPVDAKSLVLSGRSSSLMDQIHALIQQMEHQETSLQVTRSAAARTSQQRTIASIYFATLMAAIGLALLAFYIVREIDIRDGHARQLLEREEWFRSTLTGLGDAVVATDAHGLVTFLNPIAESLIGTQLSTVLGQPIDAVFPIFNESTNQPVEHPVKKVLQQVLAVGLAHHTVLRRTDGTFIPIEDSAAPIRDRAGELVGVVLVFRDSTLQRRSQELLRRTEKLAAAARLSATVAHEINNPLEAVGNLLFIAKTSNGISPDIADVLTMAEQELARISHITRQTLGFYRESKFPDQVDLSELVDSVLKIYSNKFGTKDITIERDFQPCPPITGLSGELTQAIANLISNAADAVPRKGNIRVSLFCADDVIQIGIHDDGPGVQPEHRDHIFEPFFTTKKDVGTGLGLWVTKEIVERHGGTIQVHSRNDASPSGTTFAILLPLDTGLQSPPATA